MPDIATVETDAGSIFQPPSSAVPVDGDETTVFVSGAGGSSPAAGTPAPPNDMSTVETDASGERSQGATSSPLSAGATVETDSAQSGGSSGLLDAITAPTLALAPVAGALMIDVSRANTFIVSLTQNVSSIAFTNWPTGRSERVEVYFEQDATGGRTVDFSGVKFSGAAPSLSAQPGAIDRFVFASPDGSSVFGDQVGANYQ